VSFGILVPLAAVILFSAAAFFFFIPALVYVTVIRRKKRPAYDYPGPLFPVDAPETETVRIVSRDGLALCAYYRRSPGEARGTAVLVHGYAGDARILGAEAEFFSSKLGFNVLLPDARGHGRSEGSYCGFGWHERFDIIDWMRLILSRPEWGPEQGPVVLYGVSMGAATVMMASGEELPPQVRAVIADCGYTSLEGELSFQLEKKWRVRCKPLIDLCGAYAKKRTGYDFAEASALAQVGKSKTPTLFIHGDSDDFVPFFMMHALYEACSAPKEQYIVRGASHAESYMTDPEAYEERIRAFLETYGVI
jgi:fermentation-respiration switch protein FrsA (DUF1100 family)